MWTVVLREKLGQLIGNYYSSLVLCRNKVDWKYNKRKMWGEIPVNNGECIKFNRMLI